MAEIHLVSLLRDFPLHAVLQSISLSAVDRNVGSSTCILFDTDVVMDILVYISWHTCAKEYILRNGIVGTQDTHIFNVTR